jgi:hypothetical protein
VVAAGVEVGMALRVPYCGHALQQRAEMPTRQMFTGAARLQPFGVSWRRVSSPTRKQARNGANCVGLLWHES